MSATLPVRVTVLDNWDALAFDLPADTPVAALKDRALRGARITRPADGYLVKYLGAEVSDESASLAEIGVAPHGALIVMARARIPAR